MGHPLALRARVPRHHYASQDLPSSDGAATRPGAGRGPARLSEPHAAERACRLLAGAPEVARCRACDRRQGPRRPHRGPLSLPWSLRALVSRPRFLAVPGAESSESARRLKVAPPRYPCPVAVQLSLFESESSAGLPSPPGTLQDKG